MNFFARLFQKEPQDTPAKKSVPRRQLTGFGESLTEEEAMERVRVMEEEKKRMQEEKVERAERRKRKRQEKEEATMSKRKRDGNKNNSDSPAWFCPYCLESERSDDKVWMECDQCQFWYHARFVCWLQRTVDIGTGVRNLRLPNMRERQRRYV